MLRNNGDGSGDQAGVQAEGRRPNKSHALDAHKGER